MNSFVFLAFSYSKSQQKGELKLIVYLRSFELTLTIIVSIIFENTNNPMLKLKLDPATIRAHKQ